MHIHVHSVNVVKLNGVHEHWCHTGENGLGRTLPERDTRSPLADTRRSGTVWYRIYGLSEYWYIIRCIDLRVHKEINNFLAGCVTDLSLYGTYMPIYISVLYHVCYLSQICVSSCKSSLFQIPCVYPVCSMNLQARLVPLLEICNGEFPCCMGARLDNNGDMWSPCQSTWLS